MSILNVTVKKARYDGMQAAQLNTYVTLKLQNVKSTTVTVKGPTPSWEQDFLFEINDLNGGLLVEVWNKGVIWDRALGYHWLLLHTISYSDECMARWVELEAHLVMRGGEVVGTTGQTGHALLLDCKFELPFNAETAEIEAAGELQRKLDLLNGALDAERAEQARRQMQYIAHSGYSEDSDYTSDLNYPVGQHPNCSASQYRNTAHQMHTPQRSLEVSRENSYERDDQYITSDCRYKTKQDEDPLYYNSRPRTVRDEQWMTYSSQHLQPQTSVESAISWGTATDWQSCEDQRRPSLERQETLYDESSYDPYPGMFNGDHSQFSHQTSYEEYFETSSYPYPGDYTQSEEDRQWDSGGQKYFDDYDPTFDTMYENVLNKRRSSIVQLPHIPSARKLPDPSSRYSEMNGMAPYVPRGRRTAASLPATPSSTPKLSRALPIPPAAPYTPRIRRLPRAPRVAPVTPVKVPYTAEKFTPSISYYNENYDYTQTYPDSATSYQDDEGMQPFFNETPHATPPAPQLAWSEPCNQQFNYPPTDLKIMNFQQTTDIPQIQHTYQETIETPDYINSSQTMMYNQIDMKSQETVYKDYQDVQIITSTSQQMTQPKESLVMSGAKTLGNIMSGGAMKLGSFFANAAATVNPPTATAAQKTLASSTVTPTRPGSVLQRQNTLPQPTVERLRSLPGAPNGDQFDNEQNVQEVYQYERDEKTEFYDEVDNFRYDDDIIRNQNNYYDDSSYEVAHKNDIGDVNDNIRKQVNGSRKPSLDAVTLGSRKSSQQSLYGSSPTRTSIVAPPQSPRKALPVPLERHATVDESYLEEEPIQQIIEVAEEKPEPRGVTFQEQNDQVVHYEDNDDVQHEYHDDEYQEESFQEEDEDFIQHDKIEKPFVEDKQKDHVTFKEERVKLTAKQRWHRAYNKIVMQLNVPVDAQNEENTIDPQRVF